MKSIQDFLHDDSELFGPGMDLVLSLFAILIITLVVGSDFYIGKNSNLQEEVFNLKKENERLKLNLHDMDNIIREYEGKGGNFEIANEYFSAGLFYENPVTRLKNRFEVERKVKRIVNQYREIQGQFPYIFIIGHANKIGLSYEEKSKGNYSSSESANWIFAGRRAALIGEMIKEKLPEEEWKYMVIVSAGEYDLKYPEERYSQENALVEVVFGKDWKPPSANYR